MSWNEKERRKRVTNGLRRVAEKHWRPGMARFLHEEMCQWSEGSAFALDPDEEIPSAATIRNWVETGRSGVGQKYVRVVENFLEQEYYSSLLTPRDDHHALTVLARYFGQAGKHLDNLAEKIIGEWSFYSRYNNDRTRFMRHPTWISREDRSGQIIVEQRSDFYEAAPGPFGKVMVWTGIVLVAHDEAIMILRDEACERWSMPIKCISLTSTSATNDVRDVLRRKRYLTMRGSELYGPGTHDPHLLKPVVARREESLHYSDSGEIWKPDKMEEEILDEFRAIETR